MEWLKYEPSKELPHGRVFSTALQRKRQAGRRLDRGRDQCMIPARSKASASPVSGFAKSRMPFPLSACAPEPDENWLKSCF